MSESPYPVGYGRPPMQTRFQKGQSGNPGGKAGPRKLAKQAFDRAIGEVLDADRHALRDARPAKVIEAFARRVALDAVEGEPSAQRLLVSILERGDRDATPEEPPDAAANAEASAREFLGDRYDEFNARFAAAVKAGSIDELKRLAEDYKCTEKFPASGNS